MNVIELARAMSKEIQKDERYLHLVAAGKANDSNAQLQKDIADFSSLRDEINKEAMKTDKDQSKISQMDSGLRDLYTIIMETPEMMAYNDAKIEMDELVAFINHIIEGSINGQDPDTIQKEEGCSGGCSSCSGCH
ncbi:MAG: YlbF family regulator [Oscillospiraceae bacterium]